MLDVHFKLGVVTGRGFALAVVDVVVGFVLVVLSQDVLAGHSGDDGQVRRRGLSDGRVTSVQ